MRMPVLEMPRATYAPSEGLCINYAPEFDQLAMPEQVSDLFRLAGGVAKTKRLEQVCAPRLLVDTYVLLECRSFPELTPNQPRPFEASEGGYGFKYRLSEEFKEQMHGLFNSDEDTATKAAALCFAAMDTMKRDYRSTEDKLETHHYGAGRYMFNNGPYRLSIKDGSIKDLYFGGQAGLHTAASGHQPDGSDTVHHYNNDFPHQKMGLFLGISSLVHSVYQHSLLGEMDGLLSHELGDRLAGPCRPKAKHQQC